jgi:hypothetical protein
LEKQVVIKQLRVSSVHKLVSFKINFQIVTSVFYRKFIISVNNIIYKSTFLLITHPTGNVLPCLHAHQMECSILKSMLFIFNDCLNTFGSCWFFYC